MPTFIHLANLVFDKNTIANKYNGGCDQFRIDYNIDSNEFNQEDDELFSISAMNINEFDIDLLIERGLAFDNKLNQSNDFVAITRYGGALWKTDWFNHNGTFAWHSNCNEDQKKKAIEIAEKMTMDKIQEFAEKGINVFETIRTK